jgi:hypothetical protein
MAKRKLYVPLNVAYYLDEKVAQVCEVSPWCEVLWTRCLARAKASEAGGMLSIGDMAALHVNNWRKWVGYLVEVGLLEKIGNEYHVVAWDAHNLTEAEIQAYRDRKRENVAAFRAREAAKNSDVTDTVTDHVTGNNDGYMEQSRKGEGRREKGEQQPKGCTYENPTSVELDEASSVEDKPRPVASVTSIASKGPTRADVTEVFTHWQQVMNSPKAKLDANREGRIRWALKHYTADECKQAIYGCSLTPHNMGANDRATKFNDLTLIFRDAAHFERFRDTPARPTTTAGIPSLATPERLAMMAAAQAGTYVR